MLLLYSVKEKRHKKSDRQNVSLSFGYFKNRFLWTRIWEEGNNWMRSLSVKVGGYLQVAQVFLSWGGVWRATFIFTPVSPRHSHYVRTKRRGLSCHCSLPGFGMSPKARVLKAWPQWCN